MLELSPDHLGWLEQSKYLVIFFMVMFEGAITTIAGGFLLRLGQLDLTPLYIAAVMGDFVADMGWYALGRHGAGRLVRRYGHYVGITEERMTKMEHLFHAYHLKILFISKLTMGMGFWLLTLLSAGALRIPVKNYALVNLAGGLIWIAMLIAIGYFFGNVYEIIPSSYKATFILMGLGTVASIMFLIQRKLRSIEL